MLRQRRAQPESAVDCGPAATAATGPSQGAAPSSDAAEAERPVHRGAPSAVQATACSTDSAKSGGGCDGDGDDCCWVCLGTPAAGAPLAAPCACPRRVHPRCLARWQLQQVRAIQGPESVSGPGRAA
jgi:hypothetical protein